MIAELQRISVKVGRKVITRADLLEHAELMSERALLNRFGTWKAALAAAGLELSNMGRRWSEDDYFENLLEAWTHHGRAPTYTEMNQLSLASVMGPPGCHDLGTTRVAG